jgi:hypothetical protein
MEVDMHSKEDGKVLCQECFGGTLSRARATLLIRDNKPLLCMPCGEAAAKKVKHCLVPMNKVAYMLVTDMETLKQLNPKRTT